MIHRCDQPAAGLPSAERSPESPESHGEACDARVNHNKATLTPPRRVHNDGGVLSKHNGQKSTFPDQYSHTSVIITPRFIVSNVQKGFILYSQKCYNCIDKLFL